jgi:NAD+ synthase (glutamine-hydrolysing)
MVYDGEIIIAKKGKLISKNELFSFQKINLLSEENTKHPKYTKNEEFLLADRLALYDYMRKSHSKGFVISLSGGADSSTCAVLVAEVLKAAAKQLTLTQIIEDLPFLKPIITSKEFNKSKAYQELIPHLLSCAYQGTENSGEITLNAAKELAKEIGCQFHEWKIDTTVNHATETIGKILNRELTWENDDLALQNIQARSRSPYIWMLTNIKGALLITTSNRSEGCLGYATMDGDTSGGIAPISGVDKHFVRQWLQWAESNLGYSSLNYVNAQAPTAELRPQENQQTDEDDLMPYGIMVEIERLAIGRYQSPLEVFKNLQSKALAKDSVLKNYINKFFRLWSINQWKRERLAPSFHLDDFNVDPKTWYRFPILSGGYEPLV